MNLLIAECGASAVQVEADATTRHNAKPDANLGRIRIRSTQDEPTIKMIEASARQRQRAK